LYLNNLKYAKGGVRMKGLFIVFEGIDGCGKSTVMQAVKESLQLRGYPIKSTREPGGTDCPAAEKIRDILLHSSVPLCPEAEASLFAASRAQHVRNFIIPTLQKGCIVHSDRFLWSSLVYQGVGRNLGIQLVEMINAPAVQDLSPDIIFLFDLPVSVSWKRIRKQKHDRFEKEGIKFQEKLRKAYLGLAQMNLKAVVVDAALPEKEVAETVFNEIIRRIPGVEYFKRRCK